MKSKTAIKIIPYQDFTEVWLRSSFIKDTRVKIASAENAQAAMNAAIEELQDRIAELKELKWRENK